MTTERSNEFRQSIVTTCPESSGRERFKAHLRKVGSGEQTSRGMSREESADALHLILTAQASPAQIGAFLIAHRIRRPEPQELAGMLDTYRVLGPKLKSANGQKRPICFGMPFDGRKRTAPIYPLTALVLLNAGQPVVLQGGQRMPIKYGVTTEELFKALGLQLQGLSIANLEAGFQQHGLALIYQPDHFPLAESLISYRDDIGKRPPLASLELLWTAHQGKHLLVSGFVHPPTEERAWKALALAGETNLVTVKGLEGSTDLPISRACITSRVQNGKPERLILHPRNHGCFSKDVEWSNLTEWSEQAMEALHNRGPLSQPLLWNAGTYLWLSGLVDNLDEGIAHAEKCLQSGLAQTTLEQLIAWREAII
ncbi:MULTISPECIES: anthranilate phosphoribosyltransferase family protein [Prochlorococcus]|uniref:anthranilate phosphoribosyltransferase family protein n=1 Tax=Prochlorococcus TaxID=1218 RepID=UPI0007B34EA0|nr:MULTISPECIES: anthranilate phosphoribosyltransferase family protein [Prochlorococcus]KZR64783.1 Anthranilate phosphoribosyltransferase [Prochlorococcus marinus str. MIT 1312]KZR79348.1 Anthranilate phosphoribosyltransferase [Prochlorococcus marinus str. MIT 1327]NMO84972.1 anthranilate phosphoribosyltransferase family protein [Prochlorococcus sp. P1344]NMP07273.1 anthranilate phosphoribosyltransferase family protein [Prochlorococcus sp. P1361]NMP14614.1 anthranilate phosphoribosyltransferas